MTVNQLRRMGTTIGALSILLNAFACDLLDVSDPTAIEDEQLQNVAGAGLLRGATLAFFYGLWGVEAINTGRYTDEFTSFVDAAASPANTSIDRRDLSSWSFYSQWQQLRRDATVAHTKLIEVGSRAHAGEMLAIRGYATLRLAATYCPGFPITELDGFTVVLGKPVTTTQAYERAVVDFDSAITLGGDSARVLHFARIGKAAALLGLGRFLEAASAVADVPTTYTWRALFVSEIRRNPFVFSARHRQGLGLVTTIANRKGVNGLDFLSANDPRINPRQYGTAAPPAGSNEPLYEPAKYVSDGSPIVVASGIEARLIQAEAPLASGSSTWLSILNQLRATQISPPLPPLNDPGTAETRLNLLFRERAFWLFATGQRLPDLLRELLSEVVD